MDYSTSQAFANWVTYDITATELAAANSGYRPDLIKQGQTAYLRDPSGNLLTTRNGVLYPATNIPSYALGVRAVPVILPPAGTVATNGTITLGTALPLIYANAWVQLPAGAVVGGLAGLYFVQFSSTTVGVVKSNFIDPALVEFVPNIPATIGATVVGSNAAYTPSLAADIVMAQLTVPAGSMGLHGSLKVATVWTTSNSGNVKLTKVAYGGSIVTQSSTTAATAVAGSNTLRNRGVANAQLRFGAGAANTSLIGDSTYSSTVSHDQLAVNSAVDQFLKFSAQYATATTEFVILEAYQAAVQIG